MKNVMYSFVVVLGMITLMSADGCDSTPKAPSSDKKLQVETEQAMQEANKQVGYPAITDFQEKKMLKELYELRDKSDLICHAYLYNSIKGEVGQYLGKCLGFGLPYSAQFSNPEKIVVNEWHSGGASLYGTLPQPEPNGLFMPDGLSATWLLMINPETNEATPAYIEPEIMVFTYKLGSR
jgi:hypothetical protein